MYSKDTSYVGNDWNDQVTSFIIEEAKYFIYNKHSGLVVDVAGGGKDNGTNVQQWSLNRTEAQQWKVSSVGNGYFKIISVVNGKALDVDGVSTADGANVHVWDYVGGANQHWQISAVDGDYCYIVSQNSGKSLDGDAWATTEGGNIIQWSLGNMQANQLWKFELVDSSLASANGTGSTGGSTGSTGSTSGSTGSTSGDLPQILAWQQEVTECTSSSTMIQMDSTQIIRFTGVSSDTMKTISSAM